MALTKTVLWDRSKAASKFTKCQCQKSLNSPIPLMGCLKVEMIVMN